MRTAASCVAAVADRRGAPPAVRPKPALQRLSMLALLLLAAAPHRAAAEIRWPGDLHRLAGRLQDPAKIVATVSHPERIAKAVQETSRTVGLDRAVQEVGRSAAPRKIAEAVQTVGREHPQKAADLLRGRSTQEIGKALAGAAKETAGISEDALRKVGAKLREINPELVKMIGHLKPREFEEMEEALTPENIKAALQAVEDYQWWTLHWRWAIVTIISVVAALLAGCWWGKLFWRALRPVIRQKPMLGGMEMSSWSAGKGYEQPIVEQSHFEQL